MPVFLNGQESPGCELWSPMSREHIGKCTSLIYQPLSAGERALDNNANVSLNLEIKKIFKNQQHLEQNYKNDYPQFISPMSRAMPCLGVGLGRHSSLRSPPARALPLCQQVLPKASHVLRREPLCCFIFFKIFSYCLKYYT